jgi:hypothetical protein
LVYEFWRPAAPARSIHTLFRIEPALFYVVAFTACLVSLGAAVALGGTGAFTSAAELRSLFTTDDEAGRASFGIGLSFPLTLAAWMLARYKRSARMAFTFGAGSLLLALLSTSKIFLLLFCFYAIPLATRLEKPNLRSMFLIAALILGAFTSLHLILDKLARDEGSLLTALLYTLLSYLLSGLAGFQLFCERGVDFPANAMWQTIGEWFPFLVKVPDSAILPWSQIGDWYGNVYSAFAYWIDGLGQFGFLVAVIIVALAARNLFARSDLAALFMQRLMLFALLLMFHQEFFVTALKLWLAFGLCAVFLRWTTSGLPSFSTARSERSSSKYTASTGVPASTTQNPSLPGRLTP